MFFEFTSRRVHNPDPGERINPQFLSKIFGGGGSKTTTSTQQNPWSQAIPLLNYYAGQQRYGDSQYAGMPTIGGIAKQVQPYQGQWGSDYGLSAPQIRNPVLNAMKGNQGTGRLIREGAGAGGLQAMAGQMATQSHMNPHLMGVLDRAAEATGSAIGGSLNRSGRFGGAYHTKAAGQAIGDIYRRGLTEAYENNENRRLGAMGQLGQALGLDASTRLGALQSRTQDKRLGLQASTVAQMAKQQGMDKQRMQHDAGQYAGIEANQRFLNAVLGLSGQGGTATQTARTSESASPLGTIAAIASMILGAG